MVCATECDIVLNRELRGLIPPITEELRLQGEWFDETVVEIVDELMAGRARHD